MSEITSRSREGLEKMKCGDRYEAMRGRLFRQRCRSVEERLRLRYASTTVPTPAPILREIWGQDQPFYIPQPNHFFAVEYALWTAQPLSLRPCPFLPCL